MVAMSDKTVLALLLVFVTGRAKERVEARRRGRMVLMSCILRRGVLLTVWVNSFGKCRSNMTDLDCWYEM